MKDIIDLGNRVFDRLIEAHGELQESRTLFLYSITQGSTWFILGSNLQILIEEGGVTSNFEDPVILAIDKDWKDSKIRKEYKAAQEIKKKINPDNQNHSPKDGDIFNLWTTETEFREINL